MAGNDDLASEMRCRDPAAQAALLSACRTARRGPVMAGRRIRAPVTGAFPECLGPQTVECRGQGFAPPWQATTGEGAEQAD